MARRGPGSGASEAPPGLHRRRRLRDRCRPTTGVAGLEAVPEEAVVALGLNAPSASVGAARAIALPGDDEVARGVAGDGGIALGIRRVGVDLELATEGVSGGVVALGLSATAGGVSVARAVALPGDDEVARGVAGDGGKILVARRVGVDLELVADGGSGGVVALGLNAPAAHV